MGGRVPNVKSHKYRAREKIAQRLRIFAALVEDLSWVPSTCTGSSQQPETLALISSSGLFRPLYSASTTTQIQVRQAEVACVRQTDLFGFKASLDHTEFKASQDL